MGLVFSSCIMISLQLLTLIFISMPRRQEKKEDAKKRRRHGEAEAEEKLRRGDLLVVPRTLFTHFGIYLGADRSDFPVSLNYIHLFSSCSLIVSRFFHHLSSFMLSILLQSCTFHPRHSAHDLQRHRTDCSDGHQHQAPAGSSGQGAGSCVFASEHPPEN